MLRFRRSFPDLNLPRGPVTPQVVRRVCELVLSPRAFSLTTELRLEAEHRDEARQRWEVFRGQLLDSAHTRQDKCFDEFNLFLIDTGSRSLEPLLSLKIDWAEQHL